MEPEYAVVKVRSEGKTVSCWYEYTAQEPGAMEQATPLLAYATLPYRVKVGDRLLEGSGLSKAVRRQQKKLGLAVLEQVRAKF